MKIIYSTPELEAVTSRGENKYWQGFVKSDGNQFFTQTIFWQKTMSGISKKQESALVAIVGKNIGRSNETTPEQQAKLEMNATEKKQRDKGYRKSGEENDSLLLPMLAHQWEKRKHSVNFPLYVQPKLDGCRCLSDGSKMWSRKGKEFIPEIYEHLLFDTHGLIVDGELMLPHLDFTFQETGSAIK
jgi:DNA ligase-1